MKTQVNLNPRKPKLILIQEKTQVNLKSRRPELILIQEKTQVNLKSRRPELILIQNFNPWLEKDVNELFVPFLSNYYEDG